MSTTVDIENLDVVREIVQKHKNEPGCLMPILQETQAAYGYLPEIIQHEIADGLGIPTSEVYGVATFYSQFTLVKKGTYKIGVCLGTACYVKNSKAVLDRIAEELNVEVGKTTSDFKFTLEATRCLGCCGLAPVMMINDDVYGGLVPDDIPGILAKY